MSQVVAEDTIALLTLAFRYHTVLYEMELEFQSMPQNRAALLDELGEEMAQIRAIHHWCVERLDSDRRAAIMCSKMAGVAGQMLGAFLSRLELIQWREYGLAGARRAEMTHDALGHMLYLTYAHFLNNNRTRALALLDEAMDLARQQSDRSYFATALQHRGMLYSRIGREQEGIEALEEAIYEYKQMGREFEIDKCLGSMATCHSQLEQHEKAVELYTEAIAMEGEQASGTLICNRASDLTHLGRLDDAWSDLCKAEEIAETQNDITLAGLVRSTRAHWYMAQDDPDARSKALNDFEYGLSKFSAIQDTYHEVAALQNLELMYFRILEDPQHALTYEQKSVALRRFIAIKLNLRLFAEAVQYSDQLFQLAHEATCLPDMLEAKITTGHASVLLQDYPRAVEAHQDAIRLLDEIRTITDEPNRNREAEGELYASLGQAYRHLGRIAEAVHCFAHVICVARQRFDRNLQFRATGNLGLIYADAGRDRGAILLLTRVLKHYVDASDLKMLGLAQFNLAYAYYRSGNLEEANRVATEAVAHLVMMNDPNVDTVKAQIESWNLPKAVTE